MDKDAESEISHETEMSKTQIDANIKTVERLCEFRYVRLVDYAIKSNDWFKLFAFVAEFK